MISEHVGCVSQRVDGLKDFNWKEFNEEATSKGEGRFKGFLETAVRTPGLAAPQPWVASQGASCQRSKMAAAQADAELTLSGEENELYRIPVAVTPERQPSAEWAASNNKQVREPE